MYVGVLVRVCVSVFEHAKLDVRTQTVGLLYYIMLYMTNTRQRRQSRDKYYYVHINRELSLDFIYMDIPFIFVLTYTSYLACHHDHEYTTEKQTGSQTHAQNTQKKQSDRYINAESLNIYNKFYNE